MNLPDTFTHAHSLAKSASPCMLTLSAGGGLLATWERHTATLWSVAAVTRAAGSSSATAAASRMPPPLRLRHTKTLMCLALDGGETRVAGGDITGRVIIWHGIAAALASQRGQHSQGESAAAGAGSPVPVGGLTAQVQVQVSTLHWHAGPVSCLAWSPDGSRLLSGGGEHVLVLWRPEEGAKTFLPRLGGPLTWLAHSPSDAARLCIGCGDNAVHSVNLATMQVTATVRGAAPPLLAPPPTQQHLQRRLPHAALREAPCAPLWDARTQCCVLPAAGGALQWYDTATDAAKGILHVTDAASQPAPPPPPPQPSSTPGGPAHHAPRAVEPHVCGACFGPGSEVLVTVDRRGEGTAGDDLTSVNDTLRFWRLAVDAEQDDGQQQRHGHGQGASSPSYVLMTRVDAPHGGSPVSCVAHSPLPGWAVTTSALGADFRLWTTASGTSWRCRSVGFYQSRAMTCAAFSSDASVLAVGAGDAVTLWQPTSNALLRVLYPSPTPAAGKALDGHNHLSFLAFLSPEPEAASQHGAGTPAPLLCALWGSPHNDDSGMCIFNLLSLAPVRRHAPLGGRVLACAHDVDSTAVAILMQPTHGAQAAGAAGGSRPGPIALHFSGPTAGLSAAWALRVDRAAAGAGLVFVPRAAVARHTAVSGGIAPADASGSSLLVVTTDRRFILAPLPRDDALIQHASDGATAGELRWQIEAGNDNMAAAVSSRGLGDAFGSLRVTSSAGARTAVAIGGADASTTWVSPLADVPSHALPPLTAILPVYLDALLKASEPAPA